MKRNAKQANIKTFKYLKSKSIKRKEFLSKMSSKNNFITFATQNISNNSAKLDSTLEGIIKNN